LTAHHYCCGGHWRRTEKYHRSDDLQEAFEASFLLRLQQTLIMQHESATCQSTSFAV
jgi:hypothetical protein